MKSIIILVSFILAGLSTACAQSDEDAILKVLFAQVEAWNKGDIEGYMAGYWNSDETSFVSGGTLMKGYQQVLERYKKNYATREKMGKLTFDDLRIRTISPAVVVTGIWKLTRANDSPWGRFTLIFERKPDGWRITYDHTSAAAP